jgi:hypothetical protein
MLDGLLFKHLNRWLSRILEIAPSFGNFCDRAYYKELSSTGSFGRFPRRVGHDPFRRCVTAARQAVYPDTGSISQFAPFLDRSRR